MKQVENRKSRNVVRIIIVLAALCYAVWLFFFWKGSMRLAEYECVTNNENIEVEVVGYVFNWNEAYITFNWRNHTDMDIYYGSEFQLYAERDGKWGSCPVVDENMGWNSELYMLKSGAKTDRKLYLSGFDILKEGNYRIVKEYYFDEALTEPCSFEIFFRLEGR